MALTRSELVRLCAERILVLDGAMGTMIQAAGCDEADFRGELLRAACGQALGRNGGQALRQRQKVEPCAADNDGALVLLLEDYNRPYCASD